MTFDEAFDKLIGHEGGFQRDPVDYGNWTGGAPGQGVLKGTKFGIAAASYPDEDIENLTLDRAKSIYRRDYWDRHQLDALHAVVRFDVFDGVVNSGPGSKSLNRDGAIRWLQRAARVDDDGVVGARTVAACSRTEPTRLLMRYQGERLLFLSTKMRRETWDRFGRGLVTRVATNMVNA